MIQNSYKNTKKVIYIIPTPIGNLSDTTYRSLEILKKVDVLLCEDTRVTGKFLSEKNIKLKMISYHEYNDENTAKILEVLFSNNDVLAIVSDAGFPLISDPGYELINYCNSKNISVIVIPGATSFILPLVRSGFSINEFSFYGFLKGSKNEKNEMLKRILKSKHTSVIFESKHKIINTLKEIKKTDSTRMLCLGRELTKLHEQYIINKVEEVIKELENGETRGEFVLVIKGNEEYKDIDLKKIVDIFIKFELSKKDISKAISELYNISKNEVYKFLMENYE